MDIVGPFPLTSRQRKFLLVVVDYFTKWTEAEPVARITAAQVKELVWKNIICCFSIPHMIIMDNDRQLTDKKLEKCFEDFTIKHRVTSVEHPQINGQVEAANKLILTELKKRQ